MEDQDGRVQQPVLRAGLITPWSIDIEWDDDVAATGWRVRRTPGSGRYEPTGQPYWRSTNLEPGMLHEFWVVALDEDHAEWSAKAVIKVTTSGGPADSCP